MFVCEVTRCGLTLKKASSNFERSEQSSEDDDLGHSAVEQLGRGADIRVEEEEEFCLLSFLSPEVARVSGRHNRGSGRQTEEQQLHWGRSSGGDGGGGGVIVGEGVGGASRERSGKQQPRASPPNLTS